MLRIILVILFIIPFYHLEAQELSEVIEEYHGLIKSEKERLKSNWPDVSESALKKEKDKYIMLLNKLKQIKDVSKTQDQINKDLLQFILKDKVDYIDHKGYLMPINAEGGFITSMMYAVRGLSSLTGDRLIDFKNKIAQTPRYLKQQQNNLQKGLNENISMPKVVVENCIVALEEILNAKENFLLAPLDGYTADQETVLKEAFVHFKAFLENEYLEKARSEVGVSYNSNGKEYYQQRVAYFTTTDMSPKDVFDIGQSEVKRIRGEMESIIKELNFEGDFAEFLEFLRTDAQFYATTPDELLRHAAWLTVKSQEILPKYFTQLPVLPLTVNPVPEAIAPNYTTGRYSGGSMDRKKAGEYWVNTYNLPARPLYVLAALTLHEGVPGHHLQISLAQELDLPNFRKSQYLSAYGEGWGLYAEFLGKEAGMYTTLYEDFGRLTYEMWRACRLVVDPGMHYFGWSKEKAIQFMKENTALSLHEINTEINRYIGWPAQAVSYKIGELKIRELRSRAESKLGEDFDIRLFHDKILENGSIPLNSLEKIVDQFIEDQLNR